jgi:Tol biopolymer transport system component
VTARETDPFAGLGTSGEARACVPAAAHAESEVNMAGPSRRPEAFLEGDEERYRRRIQARRSKRPPFRVRELLLIVLLLLGVQIAVMIIAGVRVRPVRIAFMSQRDGNFEIYIMGRDGANPRNLTQHESQDGVPSWSARAAAIAFLSTRDGGRISLYRMDAGGGNLTKVEEDLIFTGGMPLWSPSGEWLAVEADGPDRRDIYLISAQGGEARNLTASEANDRLGAWSPDGSRLAYVSDREGGLALYLTDLDTGETKRLTDPASASAMPAWSPKGDRIAYVSDRDGDIEIYTVSPDGGQRLRLTHSEGFDGFPTWSPSAARIAFLTVRDGNPEIYVMNEDGSNPVNLSNHPARDIIQGEAVWSPDGQQILFSSDRDGNLEVYLVDVQGGPPTNLTNNPAPDLSSIWVH